MARAAKSKGMSRVLAGVTHESLAVGTLTQSRALVVTDSFGVQTPIRPVNDPQQAATGWSMFELAQLQRDADSPRLAIFDEEILREGIRVTRHVERAALRRHRRVMAPAIPAKFARPVGKPCLPELRALIAAA